MESKGISQDGWPIDEAIQIAKWITNSN